MRLEFTVDGDNNATVVWCDVTDDISIEITEEGDVKTLIVNVDFEEEIGMVD